jgi:hypothetical protein
VRSFGKRRSTPATRVSVRPHFVYDARCIGNEVIGKRHRNLGVALEDGH